MNIPSLVIALPIIALFSLQSVAADYHSDALYEELKTGFLTPSSFYPDGNSGQLELLIMAVDRGDVETLRKLFKAAPRMAKVSEGGSRCSPIHWAAFRGDTNIVVLVLEQGEDVNHVGTWQKITPLHLAHNANTACLLMAHGANVEATDAHGQTPLMWAAERGHLDVVKALIRHGAKVDWKDANGATALYLAELYKRSDVADFLVRQGASRLSENDKKKPGLLMARINAGAPPEEHPFSSWRLISVEPVPWSISTNSQPKVTTQTHASPSAAPPHR
jgi:hypothetical protein